MYIYHIKESAGQRVSLYTFIAYMALQNMFYSKAKVLQRVLLYRFIECIAIEELLHMCFIAYCAVYILLCTCFIAYVAHENMFQRKAKRFIAYIAIFVHSVCYYIKIATHVFSSVLCCIYITMYVFCSVYGPLEHVLDKDKVFNSVYCYIRVQRVLLYKSCYTCVSQRIVLYTYYNVRVIYSVHGPLEHVLETSKVIYSVSCYTRF